MASTLVLALVLTALSADAARMLRSEGNITNGTVAGAVTLAAKKQVPALGFQDFYNGHTTGRGIWKWSNALDAYQKHFSPFAGLPVSLSEIGVQSGGSIDMWHAVMGSQCQVYGIDINPQTLRFGESMTSITIGDQADVNMWTNFFNTVVKSPLDILIDDGGHEPHQMLVTLEQTLPRMNPGGFVAIEDIHGQSYVQSFFTPAAYFIATQAAQGLVDSVHVYPYLLMVQRAGKGSLLPQSQLSFTGTSTTVSEFNQIWAAIPQHVGGTVVLENAGWGPFITGPGLTNFFSVFAALHDYNVHDVPAGCATTSAAVCTNIVTSSSMQASIKGIHIYPTRLVVEVASGPVSINALRRGDNWLDYR